MFLKFEIIVHLIFTGNLNQITFADTFPLEQRKSNTKNHLIKQKTCSFLKSYSSFSMLRLQKWKIPKK